MQQFIEINKFTGSCCVGKSGWDGGDGATDRGKLWKGREGDIGCAVEV